MNINTLVSRLVSARYDGTDTDKSFRGAMDASSKALALLADLSPKHKEGVIAAAKLFLEVATADDPVEYTNKEEVRAWES